MSSIERLRKALQPTASAFDANWHHPALASMRQDIVHLQKWVKASGKEASPPKNAIAEAVWAFRQHRVFNSFKQGRYACFGCADPVGADNYRLIEDGAAFPRLLDCADEYRDEPRRYRRCYRGLLHSYVVYDPQGDRAQATGQKNWSLLQTYLGQRFGAIRIPDSTEPDWVSALNFNREILTEQACRQLGREALDGNSSRFDEMCQQLEISDHSWVVRRFLMAQLDSAASRSNPQFRQLLKRLLDLLEQHPLFLDEGLAKVLERYRACTPLELDVGLRDFAVGHWGNPWLRLNDKRWGRVTSETRNMVTGWLKLKFMRDFFNLLAEEGNNDQRRLDFWLRYIDQIDDMHFALGSDAMYSDDEDFRRLRNEMKGRLLHLTNGGLPTNNAFLMSIGNYLMVEFGQKGNAFFAFDKRKGLPFALEESVAGNKSELKHDSHVLRLLHHDRNDGKWEQHFAEQLWSQLDVSAGAPRARSPAPPPRPTPPPPPQQPEPGSVADGGAFSNARFQSWVGLNQITVSDKRTAGGALWVHVGKAATPITAQLRKWGFRYNEHKTAWWRG
jgi:hypothetical protein